MAELIFPRTCNYWIDAGLVGLYDTLQKPVLGRGVGIGEWEKTIKGYTGIRAQLDPDVLRLEGEESQIDRALSYAMEWIRLTLYDVSSEGQINRTAGIYYNSSEGIVGFPKYKPLPGAELILKSPRYTDKGEIKELPKDILEDLKAKGGIKNSKYQKRANSCFPFFVQELEGLSFCDRASTGKANVYCVTCGSPIEKFRKNELKKWLSGEAKNFMPFVEGKEANRCFHSALKESEKCWRCGFATFFAPLLLFYRRRWSARHSDTYYALPYVPGNLKATYRLYRSLTGKRGLARVLGSEHSSINYESVFKSTPSGIPLFTLSFYYDLWSRLLPKNTKHLLKISENLGLIDERGAIFQTSVFLKRDSTGGGGKSYILREMTIDRSAYFIKLFTYLSREMDLEKNNTGIQRSLLVLFSFASEDTFHLQRLSVIRAATALTEGKHIYQYLLPIVSRNLSSLEWIDLYVINILFKKYDQWLFRKEDSTMANLVELANNAGYQLSQALWKLKNIDEKEKENLIKRYYYSIERAPSPVKFLEHARHAYHKAEKAVPKDMAFHNEGGKDDIRKFEVYRVYFLAGMLNGLFSRPGAGTSNSENIEEKEN